MAANDNGADLTDLYDRLSLEGRLEDLTTRVDDLVAYIGGSSPKVLQERGEVLSYIRLGLRASQASRPPDGDFDPETWGELAEASLYKLEKRAGDDGDIEVFKKHNIIMVLLYYALGLTSSVLVPWCGEA